MAVGWEETGATTIPETILSSIPERDNERYKPSYIARLINRSLSDNVYKNYRGIPGLKKGHFIKDEALFHTFDKGGYSVRGENGIKAEYSNFVMPSYKSGEILNALDKKFESIDFTKLNDDQIYSVAAFCTIIVGTAHPFPDGSGRAAVGVADVVIRKNLSKSLNLAEVEKRDNDLNSIMGGGTFSMFPGSYNPDAALERARKRTDKIEKVSIPKAFPEVNNFIDDFSKNIIKSINEFKPADITPITSGTTFTGCINELATFYKDLSIPEET